MDRGGKDATESRFRIVASIPAGPERDALRWVLQDEFEVRPCDPSVEACLRVLSDGRPSLVLFDLDALPETDDGFGVDAIVDAVQTAGLVVLTRPDDDDRLRNALAAGARQYLFKPLDREEVRTVFGRILRRHRRRSSILKRDSIPGAGLWTFCSPRDGIGQTALLLSLADELLTLGKDVLVVDLDLTFGDVAFMMDLPQEAPNLATLMDAELGEGRETVETHLRRHPSGLHCLVPPPRLEEAYALDLALVVERVREISRFFDFVLVDLPAGLPDVHLPLLDESRFVFVGSNADPVVFRNLRRLLGVLGELEYPAGKLRPMLTSFREGQIPLRDFEAAFAKHKLDPAPVFPWDPDGAALGLRAGQAMSRVAPKGPVAQSVRDFLLPLLGLPRPPETPGKARSFLRRLFSVTF